MPASRAWFQIEEHCTAPPRLGSRPAMPAGPADADSQTVPMTNTPYISIVIATLNSAATLRACLDSVVGQSFRDVEVLVIDGASSDETMEIVDDYRHTLSYVHSEEDRGVYSAWNKALPEVRGEWVLFLGSDDTLWDNDTLSLAAEHLRQARGDIDIVYGSILIESAEGGLIDRRGAPWPELAHRLNLEMPLPHPATFHRRSLFERRGHFDETFRIAGDYEFLLRELLEREALFMEDLLVTRMRFGGLSTQAHNRERAILETIRAQRRHGLLPYPFLSDRSISMLRTVRGGIGSLPRRLLGMVKRVIGTGRVRRFVHGMRRALRKRE